MNQRAETLATIEWLSRNLPPRESEIIKRRQLRRNCETWALIYARAELPRLPLATGLLVPLKRGRYLIHCGACPADARLVAQVTARKVARERAATHHELTTHAPLIWDRQLARYWPWQGGDAQVIPCPRCGATMHEDVSVRHASAGNRARLVCLSGHDLYVDAVGTDGRRLAGAALHDHPSKSRPRPDAQAQRRGIRSSTTGAQRRKAEWRQRMKARGLCPHCAAPCAPYAACEERRRVRRDAARKAGR